MAAVTIAPSDEACQAIVARINSGTAYTLPQAAAYIPTVIDILEEVTGLRVDVEHQLEESLEGETLDVENRTSHIIRIWIRDKLDDQSAAEVAALNLINRQIVQRVLNFDSADRRVRVWEVGKDRGEIPGKAVWTEAGFYRAYIELRVEVEAP